MLIRQCCLCYKIMGTKDGAGQYGVTSGYCFPCMVENWPHLMLRVFRTGR